MIKPKNFLSKNSIKSVFTHSESPRFECFLFSQLTFIVALILINFIVGFEIASQKLTLSDLSLMALGASLPCLILSAQMGVIIDRYPQRTLLLICNFMNLGYGLLIFYFVYNHHMGIIIMILASIGNSMIKAFYLPMQAAVTPYFTTQTQLFRSNALLQLGLSLAQIVAPILAGIGLQALGSLWVLSCAFFILLNSFFTIYLIPSVQISNFEKTLQILKKLCKKTG